MVLPLALVLESVYYYNPLWTPPVLVFPSQTVSLFLLIHLSQQPELTFAFLLFS